MEIVAKPLTTPLDLDMNLVPGQEECHFPETGLFIPNPKTWRNYLSSNDLQSSAAARQPIFPPALALLLRHGVEFHDENLLSPGTLIGWFEYFKHSHPFTFAALDEWVRMRLRSLLRHRAHRPGRETGREHRQSPNAFFAEQGLFSLAAASALARQPSRR